MGIKIFTTGGTIDKIYFDANSTYQVGESILKDILDEGNVTFSHESKIIMQKDSLDLTEKDRQLIRKTLEIEQCQRIILTHGTDTMVETALYLESIKDKVVVLTGSMAPARFRSSDAPFNIAFAVAAVQTLSPGVYLAMNGRIFTPANAKKNIEKGIFEAITENDG